MNIALLLLYLFSAVGLLLAAHNHGKKRKKSDLNHSSFWVVLFAHIIQLILIWWALNWKFI